MGAVEKAEGLPQKGKMRADAVASFMIIVCVYTGFKY